MTDDALQLFLIEADLAGRFLGEGLIAHLETERGGLDYSRESLVVAEDGLRAVFRGKLLYSPAMAIIHTGQYLGETILRALKGQWVVGNELIELHVRGSKGELLCVDVFRPCLTVVEAERSGRGDLVAPQLIEVFDSTVAWARANAPLALNSSG